MLAFAATAAADAPRRRAPCVGFALHSNPRVRERGRGVPARSVPSSVLTTFTEHLRATRARNADAATDGGLTRVLEALENAFVEISRVLRHGLRNDSVASGFCPHDGDVWQREVLRHDQRIADLLLEALHGTGCVQTVALETHEGLVDLCSSDTGDDASDAGDDAAPPPSAPAGAPAVPPAPADPYDYYMASPASARAPPPSNKRKAARFMVVLDPLGHALNADAGVAVGTIFGIYSLEHGSAASPPGRPGEGASILRRGSDMLAAGYALYGAATQLVLTRGHGVDGFTLNPELERFTLTRPRLQMPPCGRFYSVNLGHRHEWSEGVAQHVEELARSKSLRYIGTFIADVHRTLLYGGIFVYPPSRKRPAGKLRLVYEVAPIAFLMEQAGGGCTTGSGRMLDVLPGNLNQCVPVAFGSLNDVEEYVRSASAEGSHRSSSPTLGPNAVSRCSSGVSLTSLLFQAGPASAAHPVGLSVVL